METKIQCDICSKRFKTENTLATHKNKFHKEVAKLEDKRVEEENIEMIPEDSDEVILEKLKRLIDLQNFIKSCDENIVDILVSTSEDKNDKRVRWICGYEKLKRDHEFDTLEDKKNYYKDLLQRERVFFINNKFIYTLYNITQKD